MARRGDPGFPGLYGPATPPAAAKPRKLALFETDGWAVAPAGAKAAFAGAVDKLKAVGIAIATRHDDAKVAAAETAIKGARELSIQINAWEWRWPINTYRARDATKLSKSMLDRGAQAEAMTPKLRPIPRLPGSASRFSARRRRACIGFG
jgi:hypothetical protein